MCTHYMKIRSVRSLAPKYAYVPCGVCEECRRSLKQQWSFRLRVELDSLWQKKWNIGFFTLTYSDKCLPTLPKELFKNPRDYLRVPCFSRTDCRTFIDNIRKRLNERYGLKDDNRCRYMVCCEYGKQYTHRPHMHGLIAFPPNVPAEEVFKLIHSQWTKGHVFPRYISGGLDSHGYKHKPFLLAGDVARAANYAAKYCCKDIDFYASIAGLDLDKKHPLYKKCMPNHIQSKSIGLGFLANKDSLTLAKLLREGASFVGTNKTLALPLYIRNKIVFTPDYQYERVLNNSGDWNYDFAEDKWHYAKGKGMYKRLVRRVANQFFIDNIKQIYEQKVQYYTDLFKQMSSNDFWTSRIDVQKFPNFADKVKDFGSSFNMRVQQRFFDCETLARYYVSYYGVPANKCYFADLSKQYLWRYLRDFERPNVTRLVDPRFLETLNKLISYSISYLKFCDAYNHAKLEDMAKISDYYKHLT